MRPRLVLLLYVISLLQLSQPASAQDFAAESGFVRFVPGTETWQGELQTAVVSFENAAGAQLDLVAAVHIGDSAYYEGLNSYFISRDAVLYELIADPGDRPTPGSLTTGGSGLGFVQQSLASFLNVDFQLQQIDYSPANFRHADLNPTQLQEIMRSKNENFFSMFFSLALAQMAATQNGAGADAQLSAFNLLSVTRALVAEDQANAFKYLFAEELGRSDGMNVGPALEQQLTILGDRNRVALKVLTGTLQEIPAGRISLFYGAAHMPGIEREITKSLAFTRTGQRWLSAWRVP